ncbi:ATP synthase F0F1 subunit epsilon [Haemophilus influenzae biotype aegyptius]|uniref:F0F1 ATP synthase subunit epsilon n=1 Tax=Haemophilus influenzae TaxID=727 RepID=UPI0001F36441|nr:F0F1 ATP synthase subunit epsilon [Haemophilus influenzae]QEQ62203.1 F0F1 ATP synthase subunit epsilon [Haemophilus influenzae biotype aegyptius]QEQ64083.1 F0F1 ATP synthase subunit epsilon [Haemophilus influenzae biotype aegyptius]QEQ65767.1 F0F1 ATP synthase subunit epsilon [Haemophilus influenzae biotype aegyptius]TMQ37114.1 ATP synthase F0F1 subunit epsilon [Haemophilus influenzae biotype aegyptius]TMQ37600.1 ATP synthase F0F1 subunit epsilon [Haemophilus influenzae biotype aegyptius]
MATFNLTIVSAEQKIFEGEVKQIQVTGVEGELGILPGHTPLLTAIKPGIVKFTLKDGNEEVIYVSGGFLEVQPNIVTVLADIAIRGSELDADRIQEAKRKAEENIVSRGSDADHDLLVAKLSKELAKLRAYELTEKLLKTRR